MVAGMIPLAPYLLRIALHTALMLSCVVTGVALAVFGAVKGRYTGEPALRSASYIIPRDRRSKIDGFLARDGKIEACFEGVLSAPAGQRPRPFDLIFETPALAPIDLQVEAAVTALDTILDEYRVFLAYAQNL